jgi:hypothetical protein
MPEPRKAGRPPGKKSNPNYATINAKVPRDLKRALKVYQAQESISDMGTILEKALCSYLREQGHSYNCPHSEGQAHASTE